MLVAGFRGVVFRIRGVNSESRNVAENSLQNTQHQNPKWCHVSANNADQMGLQTSQIAMVPIAALFLNLTVLPVHSAKLKSWSIQSPKAWISRRRLPKSQKCRDGPPHPPEMGPKVYYQALNYSRQLFWGNSPTGTVAA